MKKKAFMIPTMFVGMSLVACGGKPTPDNYFNVTWDLDNGTSPIVERYKKGEMPSCKETPAYKFGHDEYNIRYFADWDKPLEPVSKDVTYKAIYEEDEVRVATCVTLIGILPKNDTFTFAYEGDLVAVDWGDGTALDESKSTSHKYIFPDNKPISVMVTIYGRLTSFALANEEKLLGTANLAAKSIVLAETIKKVPDYAFAKMYYVSSVLLDSGLKYVGKNAVQKIGSSSSIYLQSGLDEDALQPGWNPDNRHVVKNVTKVVLQYDETSNAYYAAIGVEMEQEHYLAISAFYPCDSNVKEFENLIVPSLICGDKVDAIIYTPFRSTAYRFKSITLPDSILYIGDSGLRYTDVDEIKIPSSVIEIGDKAFENVTATKITFTGDNPRLTTIGEGAFSTMLKLTTIDNLPSTIETIGSNCFHNIANLENLDGFGDTKITTIPEYAIGATTKLTKLVLPETLKLIKGWAITASALNEIDASKFTNDNVPVCEEVAFIKTATNVTIKVNSCFADAEAAKAAFTAQGWPSNFTYQLVTD